jgi:hypothetical protein
MISLKITKPGYTIAIPGLPVFRSPVEIDISKLDIRVVSMYLETAGITEYEIVAELKNEKEVYTAKDFQGETKKRVVSDKKQDIQKNDEVFDRLEEMFLRLLQLERGNTNKNEEQIIDKLNKLQEKLDRVNTVPIIQSGVVVDNNNCNDNEYESYIPEIDTSDMVLKSSDNLKTVKKEDDSEEAADILAGLISKKKGGRND